MTSSAVTEACSFLAIPEERGQKGDIEVIREHKRQAHVNSEISALPKKAQLQYNPSAPGFSDPPHRSLQTKAGWRKARCFEMVPCELRSKSLLAHIFCFQHLHLWIHQDALNPVSRSQEIKACWGNNLLRTERGWTQPHIRPGSELRERNILKGAILSLVRLTYLLLSLLLLASRAHPAAARESREQLSLLQAGTVPAKIEAGSVPAVHSKAPAGADSSSSCAAAPAHSAFIYARPYHFMNI